MSECPKNLTEIKYPNYDNIKLDHDDKWKIPESEMKEKFKKSYEITSRSHAMTRTELWENFMLEQLTDEYIKIELKNLNKIDEPMITEYSEMFSNKTDGKLEIFDQKLLSKYPINAVEPITFWNQLGLKPTPFKQNNFFTKRNICENLDVQFG